MIKQYSAVKINKVLYASVAIVSKHVALTIHTHTHTHKIYNGERAVSSINGAGKTKQLHIKN